MEMMPPFSLHLNGSLQTPASIPVAVLNSRTQFCLGVLGAQKVAAQQILIKDNYYGIASPVQQAGCPGYLIIYNLTEVCPCPLLGIC